MEPPLQRRVQRCGWDQRYLDAIAPWRHERRYAAPGEFVVVTATGPADN